MNIESIYKLSQQDREEGFSGIHRLIIDHLDAVAALEDDRLHKRLLEELIEKYVILEKRVDRLLKNTLPEKVANEIKYEGRYEPRPYDCAILFTDIVGFTHLVEHMPGNILIDLLDRLFRGFDDLIIRFGGTKIKTIGDAYMAVFGALDDKPDYAAAPIRAGLSLFEFQDRFNRENRLDLQMRIGIHAGRVMAGVVGSERMQFDVFGDDVNIAARLESSGESGRVNVSQNLYLTTKDRFFFKERGEIPLKYKANMKAYFVLREKP